MHILQFSLFLTACVGASQATPPFTEIDLTNLGEGLAAYLKKLPSPNHSKHWSWINGPALRSTASKTLTSLAETSFEHILQTPARALALGENDVSYCMFNASQVAVNANGTFI